MKLRDYKDVVYQIIGAAMVVHAELHKGLLEPIYQEALSWELEQRGISNRREAQLSVFYKEHELKDKNIRSYYWTTKLNTDVDCSYSALASNIYCGSHCYSYVPRCFGCCIRPVINL